MVQKILATDLGESFGFNAPNRSVPRAPRNLNPKP